MIKCGNRSGRDKDKSFYRLPTVITYQGEQALELSTQRQLKWLVKMNRKDIRPKQYSNTRVCSDHFISGSPSALFDDKNPDVAPSKNDSFSDSTCIEAKSGRYMRAIEWSRKRRVNELEQEESETDSPIQVFHAQICLCICTDIVRGLII